MPVISETAVTLRVPSAMRADLDDQVDGRRDLLADRLLGNVEVGHRHHRVEAIQRVARGVGVDRSSSCRRGRCSSPAACRALLRCGPRRRLMRSGRIRRALTTSSRCRTAPLPSILAGRVSSRTTCRCRSFNSAASSIVTTRSLSLMKLERMLSSVVLPAPVPPDTMMFKPARRPPPSRNVFIGCVHDSRPTRSSAPSLSVRKRRIDSTGTVQRERRE